MRNDGKYSGYKNYETYVVAKNFEWTINDCISNVVCRKEETITAKALGEDVKYTVTDEIRESSSSDFSRICAYEFIDTVDWEGIARQYLLKNGY
jgi:hypothetical protein